MNLRQASGGVSLSVLFLATAFSGCGASGGSTAGSGGQSSATGGEPAASGGDTSNQSTNENTGGAPAAGTTAAGGNSPAGGANATGGKAPTGGAPTTGGRTGTGGASVVRCNSNVTVSGCTPGQLTQTGTLNGRTKLTTQQLAASSIFSKSMNGVPHRHSR